jgi:protein gp37
MMPANFGGNGFANVWLGATVVTQEEADRDIPKLLATPARVRFLSIEPMLGPIDLGRTLWACCGNLQPGNDHGVLGCEPDRCCGVPERRELLDWVIVGGESGAGARRMPPEWVRSLRDQCARAGVPFHFKQWGEWLPIEMPTEDECFADDGTDRQITGRVEVNMSRTMGKVGKSFAGRTLDGIVHDAFPQVA